MNELVDAAQRVRTNAYAPYSVYQVGAAVLGSNGRIYVGCNVENVSFGLTMCAERNAIGSMVADGCRAIQAVAVVTKDGGTPCGMCRQALLEFAQDASAVRVWCASETGVTAEYRLVDLIPDAFRSELKQE